MEFQEFLEKHRQTKEAIRTYLMIFCSSGENSYLERATDSFKDLKKIHDNYKAISGCCPITQLMENHKKEEEHRSKLSEIQKELERTARIRKEITETETILAKVHGKVTWKKAA